MEEPQAPEARHDTCTPLLDRHVQIEQAWLSNYHVPNRGLRLLQVVTGMVVCSSEQLCMLTFMYFTPVVTVPIDTHIWSRLD